jgi:hypothetical protein
MSKTIAATLYMYKIEHRVQICFAKPLGELKFKFANGGKIINPFIHDPFTRQGLSNQTTFRPV